MTEQEKVDTMRPVLRAGQEVWLDKDTANKSKVQVDAEEAAYNSKVPKKWEHLECHELPTHALHIKENTRT